MQTPIHPMPIQQLVDTQLQPIVAKAELLTAIDRVLKQGLDAALCSHFQVANVKGEALVIIVDSAAWATRLRFHTPQLLATVQSLPPGKHIMAIHYRVRPLEQPVTRHYWQKIPLSADSAAVIQEGAETICDLALKNALLRLAGLHSK